MRVTIPNQAVDKGYIHVISAMMTPPQRTILQILEATGKYSQFYSDLVNLNLNDTLASCK